LSKKYKITEYRADCAGRMKFLHGAAQRR